jgi:hypothetical protein
VCQAKKPAFAAWAVQHAGERAKPVDEGAKAQSVTTGFVVFDSRPAFAMIILAEPAVG